MLAKTPHWPPDYVAHINWRLQKLEAVRQDPVKAIGMREYYRTRRSEFITHWCDTYNPRHAGIEGKSTSMPFILFPRQLDYEEFLTALYNGQAHGMCEKSRDMGITWESIAFSVHLFCYEDGVSVGWGSRKEALVDKIGDMDSIFEKTRWLLRRLPSLFLPRGFDLDRHMSHMKIVSPETGSSITGEGGDDIGRGGRKRIYFVDEAAHLERPETVEASLGDNTDCRVDISSVAGPGNVFHNKRQASIDWDPSVRVEKGRRYVFTADWRDHPEKTQEWYVRRETQAKEDGLLHVFRSEVDRNYYAAIMGVIIDAEWIDSAIDADTKLGLDMTIGGHVAGLDVADNDKDSDGDRNGWAYRKGVKLLEVDEWGERDTAHTARRVITLCPRVVRRPISVQYDCIGVGSGIKAEANRLGETKDSEGRLLSHNIDFVPWNAGHPPLRPKRYLIIRPNGEPDYDSPKIGDFFKNIKAQGWWELARRFERTHRMVKDRRVKYPVDQLICISGQIPRVKLESLKRQLTQPVKTHDSVMRMLVDKKPKGSRSPNMGDATMQCFWPIPVEESTPSFGSF